MPKPPAHCNLTHVLVHVHSPDHIISLWECLVQSYTKLIVHLLFKLWHPIVPSSKNKNNSTKQTLDAFHALYSMIMHIPNWTSAYTFPTYSHIFRHEVSDKYSIILYLLKKIHILFNFTFHHQFHIKYDVVVWNWQTCLPIMLCMVGPNKWLVGWFPSVHMHLQQPFVQSQWTSSYWLYSVR